MPKPVEPEIIPPNKTSLSDEQLNLLATLLDDLFQIPGTSIRFGLDPVIGLIPGAGDLITSAISLALLFAAWQRGAPRVTIARMMANVALDSLAGSVPVLGDIFDVAWKSNRRNLDLLRRTGTMPRKQQQFRDWIFLALLLLAAAALIALPFILLLLLVHEIRR